MFLSGLVIASWIGKVLGLNGVSGFRVVPLLSLSLLLLVGGPSIGFMDARSLVRGITLVVDVFWRMVGEDVEL